MRADGRVGGLAAAALWALLGAGVAAAHDGNAHGKHAGAAQAASKPDVTVAVHDVDVRLARGGEAKLASGVIGDRLVALTLFYSTCTTTCPITNAIFAQVQKRLGTRLGEEVRLVSLTVDPTTDTPERLAAMAAKHGAAPGWAWVTGEKRTIDRVLDGLNAYTPDYTQHPIIVLVGDPVSGDWTRMFGFPNPDAIVARLDALAATRSARAKANSN